MSAPAWWQRGAIYQVYPRSFADADGDGVGDLAGHHRAASTTSPRSRVEAVWLSPFFPSPMADFGYDVSDYCDVDPVFGTLADFDRARGRAATRAASASWSTGCPNHTSDRHPWFEASRSSARRPASATGTSGATRRPDGGPPNDWRSAVRGLRAGVDARRAHRPVLPALVHARAARPQLGQPGGRGGDARHAALLARPRRRRLPARRDRTRSPRTRCCATTPGAARRHDEDWDSIHGHLRGIRRVVDAYADRMIVGEVALRDLHRVVGYLQSGDQLHLAHNFVWAELPWDADAFRTSIERLRRRSPTRRPGRRGSSPTTTSRACASASAPAGRASRAPARSR